MPWCGASPVPGETGLRAWLWPLLTMSTIVFASSHSKVAAPDLVGIDKVAHFFVYGLLATLLYRTRWFTRRGRAGAIAAVLAAIVFGLTDEAHQQLTPGRSVEWADLAVDAAGAALAVLVYTRWSGYRRFLEFPCARRVDSPA
jgi:VanZ family protein